MTLRKLSALAIDQASQACLTGSSQPGVVDLAVDEKVGPHPVSDREQRHIGDALLGPFRKIGQRGKLEGRAADRHHVKSDRDGMADAEDLALDAEIAAQSDAQAIGQHHQPRRDRFAIGQRELLPLRAGRDIGHLGVDEFGGGGDFGADRADQRVLHDAVLAARLLVEQIAESRDPVFVVMGG